MRALRTPCPTRQVLRQARGLAEHERQHAGGLRIERAGMPDAADPQRPARHDDDVVRARADRFVDDENAVDGLDSEWR